MSHISIDISNTSIKVAEAIKEEKGFRLLSFGEVKTPASLQSSNPHDEMQIEEAVKDLINKTKVHSKEVYVCIPEAFVYSRVISLPNLEDSEVEGAIKFEAEQYIPIPLDEVFLEYQVLFRPPKEKSEEKMEVLIIAIKKKWVERILDLFEKLEMVPLVMETSLLATLRSIQPQLASHSMVVDIGHTAASMAIFQHGILKNITTISTAGEALTRALVQSLSLTTLKAEQYKHSYGVNPKQLEGKLLRAMKIPLEEMVATLKKSIQYTQTTWKEGHIDQLIVTGGTAIMPGFIPFLASQLVIEVILANPLARCINTNLPKELIQTSARFSGVIGSAIRD